MEKYTLRQCTLTQLDRLFGLRNTLTSDVLTQWLQQPNELTEVEKTLIGLLQTLLIENAEGWNEQELALHFIGPMFSLVHFTERYRFNLFAERRIGAIVPGVHNDIELYGEPDGLIATGYREPEIPLFAFSEYKRQLDPTGDPAGQVLAAMLVGQALDPRPKPLYGCYVVGYDWRFMVLQGKEYTISKDYSALRDDVFDIFCILKTLKQIILTLTAT
ncbi:MAG: hypothetical protein KDE19_20395 [Caldilineaceae bacterium]|nr:hypothetical protein [Caldilineaceae bacterium]